jgi:hypothetical protein
MLNTDMLSMYNMQEYGDEKSIFTICKLYANYMHTHTRHIHIPCFYMTLIIDMTEYAKKICRICTYPIFGTKKIVKYEKNAKYVYLRRGVPAAGRPGVKS